MRTKTTTEYRIRDKNDELIAVHEHVRNPETGDKQCFWRRPGGEPGLNGTPLHDLPLYGAHEFDDEAALSIVVEGEKARDELADALKGTRVNVLGTVTGAGQTPGPEALEVLRGHEVVLWPDADEPGSAHMMRVAQRLDGIAAMVRVFDWPEATEKEDAADHPAVQSRNEKGLDRLLNDLCGAPEFHSFESYRDIVSNETHSLPFRTAKHISEEVPEETKWIAFPWFAEQTITEVSGAIKSSGKTTFLTCAARKILDGAAFMGTYTTKTQVVYLTEQGPTSFRKALKTANLEDREDFHVLYWHDAIGVPWSEVVRQATDYAIEVGAGFLIVDVISRWTGLEGDSENSSGAAMEAMKPLKEAVGQGLAVAYARHDRKGGGDVGESGRGSTQFGGDADQLLHLKRPEGNTRKTVRVLESLGRFSDETPEAINIELDPERGEYRSLGDSGAFVEKEAMSIVVDILPTTPENAWETRAVVDKAAQGGCKRSATINALNKLTEAGTVKRLGEGKKNSPYRYYKPLPGQENNSFETPSPRVQTNELNGHSDHDAHVQDTRRCKHEVPGGCWLCQRETKKLVDGGMSEKWARDEILSYKEKKVTRVVNVKSGEPYDVYIGWENGRYGLKRSDWHNPFKIGKDGTREEVVEKFERYLLEERPDLVARLPELKGKVLACWCAPELCHGHVLARLADKEKKS